MSENHSQHEANKLIRVLSDKPLKFTIRVHHANGKCTEWQSDQAVRVNWHEHARALWFCQGDYETRPIMPWLEGDVCLLEENPKE